MATISTHTLNDATTTILVKTMTTTIINEIPEGQHHHNNQGLGHSMAGNVKKSLREYWFPSILSHESPHHSDQVDEDDEEKEHTWDSLLSRARDYWHSLTVDAEEQAKALVIEAREARDKAAIEARFAILGYNQQARDAYEAAEKKYREALAAAEKAHEVAHEKAKSAWFSAVDRTQKEVEQVKGKAAEVSHQKWDNFKAAVDSLAFNPPKYGCSPSANYWFSTEKLSEKSPWDCKEIIDSHDHKRLSHLRPLPKRKMAVEKVHDTLMGLLQQARLRSKSASSSTSFDTVIKSVQDHYKQVLERLAKDEKASLDELEMVVEKAKAKLNEAKYYEEQTDSWLTTQWNAIIDNAGEAKDQYQELFKGNLKAIQRTRTDAYNTIMSGISGTIQSVHKKLADARRSAHHDKAVLQQAIQSSRDSLVHVLKEAEERIKSKPKATYDGLVDAFNRDANSLKAKIQSAASNAQKSASSISHHASKSASSFSRHATDAAKSVHHDASKGLHSGFHQATASVSSMWGAATPFAYAPLNKAHNTYHQMLDDTRSIMFDRQGARYDSQASSFYGALLAFYLLFLARRIWIQKYAGHHAGHPDHVAQRYGIYSNRQPSQEHAKVNKDGSVHHRRHSHSSTEASTEDRSVHKFSSDLGLVLPKNDAVSAVLIQFLWTVPVTLFLMMLLELSGFSRLGLHALFMGLVTSQVIQCGFVTRHVETWFGLGEDHAFSGAETGQMLSLVVLGLAGGANLLKCLVGL